MTHSNKRSSLHSSKRSFVFANFCAWPSFLPRPCQVIRRAASNANEARLWLSSSMRRDARAREKDQASERKRVSGREITAHTKKRRSEEELNIAFNWLKRLAQFIWTETLVEGAIARALTHTFCYAIYTKMHLPFPQFPQNQCNRKWALYTYVWLCKVNRTLCTWWSWRNAMYGASRAAGNCSLDPRTANTCFVQRPPCIYNILTFVLYAGQVYTIHTIIYAQLFTSICAQCYADICERFIQFLYWTQQQYQRQKYI